MNELVEDLKTNLTINEESTGKLCLSLGTKGSGKTHFMNLWLKYCIANNLYDIYFLVLPSYSIESNDSYAFLDPKSDQLFIFEEYRPIISEKIMKFQRKNQNSKTGKKKVLFVIDDSSGEKLNSFQMDNSMKKLITSVRHFNCVLWIISHAICGTLSTFIRANMDLLLLYNCTSQALLESVFSEFLSMHPDYRQNSGIRKNMDVFISQFLQLHEKEYQALYLNLRNRTISTQLSNVSQILQKYYK